MGKMKAVVIDKVTEANDIEIKKVEIPFVKPGWVLVKVKGFDPIKDIPNGVCLTGFFSNYPTQKIVDDIFEFFKKHNLKPIYGPVYRFDDIKDAIAMQDSGRAGGKIVVVME